MYAIIGVTGHVGSAIAANLQNKGLKFKGIARSGDRSKELEEKGINSVVAELHDTAALTMAFTDTDGVFIMTPPLLDSEAPLKDHHLMLDALTQAIEDANPPKVVYLSSVGAQHKEGTGAIRELYDMEQAFQKLSAPTVSIRAAWFMENFIGFIGSAYEHGKLMSFINPTSKSIPMVSAKDIGKLAAGLLQQEWTGHRIVELSGPGTYSTDDVAMILQSLLNRNVTAEAVAADDYEAGYRSFGFTAKAAELMGEMNRGFNTDHIVFEGNNCEYIEGEILLENCLRIYVQ